MKDLEITLVDELYNESGVSYRVGDIVEVERLWDGDLITHKGEIVTIWERHMDVKCEGMKALVPIYFEDIESIKLIRGF